LAAGLRSRATGRRLDVDKATVKHARPLVGPHGQHVIHDCCRTLPLHEGHLDALGTCIAKKAAYLTQLEQWAAVYGDAWGWMACSPLSKRGPAGVGDTRTWRHARRLVWQLQAATDGPIPCCASDAWPHAAEALQPYLVCGARRRVKARATACPTRAGAHRLRCAMRWWSTSGSRAGSSTS
jgi:hypothetical protein